MSVFSGPPPDDFVVALRDIYVPAGLKVTEALREAESADYGACRFRIGGLAAVFRVAKTTPTKIGQFVTCWKRPTTASEIAPLDKDDDIAFLVVSVSDLNNRGQFIFDRDILLAKGIMSRNRKGGKRAIRVYPPWSKPTAKDAVKTQKWQIDSFLPVAESGATDPAHTRKLFGF
jgi:hypothetical protein